MKYEIIVGSTITNVLNGIELDRCISNLLERGIFTEDIEIKIIEEKL